MLTNTLDGCQLLSTDICIFTSVSTSQPIKSKSFMAATADSSIMVRLKTPAETLFCYMINSDGVKRSHRKKDVNI